MRPGYIQYVVNALIFLIATISIAPLPTSADNAPWPQDQLKERLRNRLEVYSGKDYEVQNGSSGIHSLRTIKEFYEKRGFEFAWIRENLAGGMTQQMIQAIEMASLEGLNPSEYHLERIRKLAGELDQTRFSEQGDIPARLVNLELLLTDAFFTYGKHLLSGRITPEKIDPEWVSNKRVLDLPPLLEDALAKGAILKTLSGLPPSHSDYMMLRKALADYRSVEYNSQPVIELPKGKALRLGDESAIVQILRRRLQLPQNTVAADQEKGENGSYFDEELENSVRRFQQQHGLDPDGVVGAQTVAALNLPVSERIKQILLNMERWRWLPHDLGQKHITVNIADYSLQVIENGRQVLGMKVVVGRDYRRTPVFSEQVSYLVLNPSWHVPPSIAVKDKLPLLRKDPQLLKRDGFRVYQRTGEGLREVDPAGIDWSGVSSRKFPYTLRQDPGQGNALGRIKFMFPNRFNVYLHDTPSRELFQKSFRSYSSGCVRLEKPLELATLLLQTDDKWTVQALNKAIALGKEQTLVLKEKVPIHILYLTAFVDQSGGIQFRPDIYGRDALLKKAW